MDAFLSVNDVVVEVPTVVQFVLAVLRKILYLTAPDTLPQLICVPEFTARIEEILGLESPVTAFEALKPLVYAVALEFMHLTVKVYFTPSLAPDQV